MSTLLTRPEQTEPRLTGRHRLGRAGLIPATALVTVVRRGLFRSLFRAGRHRASPVPAAPRALGPTAVRAAL